MSNLPQAFVDRMAEQLGDELPAFLRTYEEPYQRGIRLNPMKAVADEFLPEGLLQLPVSLHQGGKGTKRRGVALKMGGDNDMGHAGFCRHPGHFQGLGKASGAVVVLMKNVTVNVDHDYLLGKSRVIS